MGAEPSAVFVSFRLGGLDGVSVEVAKWEWALGRLGFSARRVAGEILDARRPDDTVIPELAIGVDIEPDPSVVEAALGDATLVVVDNLLSLPLNLGAARVVAKVLADHPRVLLRHHDLPWQREQFVTVDELPPRLDSALHVVINDLSHRELSERGVPSTVIRNHFDVDPEPGDRREARLRLGIGDPDLLLFHPVRAIPRKNVPGALSLAASLGRRLPGTRVVYWLPGPAEDGYDSELAGLLAGTGVEFSRAGAVAMNDAYAACDLVVFPSVWEGFGNPVIESVTHRRPLAVDRYPVLHELTRLGLRFLDATDPAGIAAVLAGVRNIETALDQNLEIARDCFALDLLPGRLQRLLRRAGWLGADARTA